MKGPERPLAELVSKLWRECYRGGTMPRSPRRDVVPAPTSLAQLGSVAPPPTPESINARVRQDWLGDDILGDGVPSSMVGTTKMTVACYGRNGVGKTTLSCQGEGPIALLAIDPSPTGGARSVSRPDVVVYQIAARYLDQERADAAGNRLLLKERVKGSEKVLAIAEAIKARSAAGACPFKRVVVDGLNSWFEVILSEVLRVDYESMPAILTKEKVSTDQYVERTERLIRYLRPIMDLPCDVWLLAQEKDHNPPRDDKNRVRGSKFMREAHPEAQDGSFYSLAISDEAARWVQNASDFVLQLYEDNEYREERLPDVNMNGTVVPGVLQMVPTGRRVKRLRCVYHPNYAARFRSASWRDVPLYIEAPGPEERYAAFLAAARGERSPYGRYATNP